MYLIRTKNNNYNCFYCNFETSMKFNLKKHLSTKKHLEKVRSTVINH